MIVINNNYFDEIASI